MSYLWQNEPEESGWQPVLLSPGAPFHLGPCILRNVATSGSELRSPWCLVPSRQSMGRGIRVNAEPLGLGIRVLADRDTIAIGDGAIRFFTDEEPARVQPFPDEKSGTCARCRNAIAPGELAVRCPGCGAWSNQSEDLPCWGYEGTSTCPLCDQPNTLDVFRWSPADEGW